MRRWIITIALAVFLGGPAEAAAGPECSCRYKGRDVPVGGQVCLNTPQGMRVATCGFELNNTSWKFSKRSCGQVAGQGPGHPRVPLTLKAWMPVSSTGMTGDAETKMLVIPRFMRGIQFLNHRDSETVR